MLPAPAHINTITCVLFRASVPTHEVKQPEVQSHQTGNSVWPSKTPVAIRISTMLSRRNDCAILVCRKEIHPKPCQGPWSSPRLNTLGWQTVLSGKVRAQQHCVPTSSNMTPIPFQNPPGRETGEPCSFKAPWRTSTWWASCS